MGGGGGGGGGLHCVGYFVLHCSISGLSAKGNSVRFSPVKPAAAESGQRFRHSLILEEFVQNFIRAMSSRCRRTCNVRKPLLYET